MKIGEVIQRVQSLYSKGVQSDSSRLTPRHIYSKLVSLRSKLLSEKAKKKQKISDWNYQVLSCIELIDVQAHECPCIPVSGCTVKKSKYKIPKVMLDYNGNLIDYVMTIDSFERLDPTNRVELLYLSGNRYTSHKWRYIIENGFLYAYGKRVPVLLRMRAVFEDPIEVSNFISYCQKEGCPEDVFDIEFPMDADQIDTMIELAAQELVVLFSQSQNDITNDNEDVQRVQPK